MDLRCPFGCSASHRRQCSTKRSAAYYRTEAGKQKKSQLNRRRYLSCLKADTAVSGQDPDAQQTEDPCAKPILEYVRMVTGLIEGRKITRVEFSWILQQIFRQHRLGHNCRAAYACGQSNKSPP
jgi:hypothetical protein